jgi:hypothetical protein
MTTMQQSHVLKFVGTQTSSMLLHLVVNRSAATKEQAAEPAKGAAHLLNSVGTQTSSMLLQCCTRCAGSELVSNMVRPTLYTTCQHNKIGSQYESDMSKPGAHTTHV